MKRETAEWLVCMLVASIGLVYALWVVPYIPSVDGPQHILSVHIENHYSDAGSSYPDYYVVLPQFAAKGFALIFGPLESVLPWRVALRLTFSLLGLAFAWGFALVVLAIDRKQRPTAMLGFAVALPWSLYMGFFPFVVGTTFGLYTLAFVLHRPPTTNARHAILAALLLVQAVCHVFTAIVTGALVTVLAIVGAPKERRLGEIGRMALVGAPAAAIFGLTFRGRNTAASEAQGFVWSFSDRLGEIARWFVPGPSVRGWLVIALVIGSIGAMLARARKGRATPIEHALAWLALGFVAFTLLAPIDMPGWNFFAPRFAVLAAVLGLALVRVPGSVSPRMIRALVPLLALSLVGWDLASASLHRQLASGCADVLAGLDAPLQFAGPRLPIILDSSCGAPGDAPVPGAAMAYNTPLLYLVEHGGIGTKMFNGMPAIHAIAFTGSKRPPRPDPRAQILAQSQWVVTDQKLRTSVLTELAADGMPFEGIQVVGGRPADFTVFKDRGYTTELENGSLFIGRFEGCPAELVLSPNALDREPVLLEYGLFSEALLTPQPRVLGAFVIKPDAPVVGGAIHVPLQARPCGEVWLRVVRDVDKSSSLTPGDRTCENADRQGRLHATLTRDHAAVICVTPP